VPLPASEFLEKIPDLSPRITSRDHAARMFSLVIIKWTKRTTSIFAAALISMTACTASR
jgi:hypothetical protein